MRKKQRNKIAFLLVFILSLGIMNTSMRSESSSETAQKQVVFKRKMEIYVEYLKMQDKVTHESNLYDIVPSSQAPYIVGSLKQTVLESALATTNFVRALAYLNSNVKLDESWNNIAQYAAVLNAANGTISHKPTKRSDMSNEFYQVGYGGSGTSNLYKGFLSLDDTVIKYLYDSDPSNIDRMGHRRWVLNPAMTKVGFGYIDTNGPNSVYSAMKLFGGKDNDLSGYKGSFDYVAWPSKGAFPNEYFSDSEGWSVVLNTKLYDNSKLDDIKVILENMTTGLVQTFSKTQMDGYFNVETSYYGAPYCIVFKPNAFQTGEGSHYKVTINGLRDLHGNQKTISYETEFFNLSLFKNIIEENSQLAELFFQMGVFKGTDQGFELERAPTRLEGLVMLIRLLGQENAALSMALEPCVFKDVPDWGRGYVNYAYKAGLTKGISESLFGSKDTLEARAYMTYMLRALGYSDALGDFRWDKSLEKGKELGIMSEDRYKGLKNNRFVRGDVAALSYFTLKSKAKDSDHSLLQDLVNQGTIDGKFLTN